MPNELILFINAIVVALMAMYVYNNERKLDEISAKYYRTEAQMTFDISENKKRIGEVLAEQKKDQSVIAQMTFAISKNEETIEEISAEQKKDQLVLAQMTLNISKNEKRIGEISAEQKKDQSVVAQMTLNISNNEKKIGEISAEQKKIQSVVAQMAVQISNIEKRIVELEKEKSEIRPAFTAHFKNGGYMNLGHQNLIFDSVRLNIGNGYNLGTGYFIVPRAGLYLVSCKVRSNHRTHLHVWLRKNNEDIILGYGENYNEGSFSIPVQVAKEDKLVIRHGNTGESVEGGVSSFFSAVFISDSK